MNIEKACALAKSIIFLVALGFVMLCTGNTMAGAKGGGLPSLIPVTAYNVGASGNMQASAVGAAFRRKYNVTIRIIPGETGIARITPLKSKAADFGIVGTEFIMANEGLDVFASNQWGPQQLRTVWASFPGNATACAVTKRSGINTPADLKGKRLVWIVGGASLNRFMIAFLAFADLSANDVTWVKVPGYGAGVDALKDGRADAIFANSLNASFEEVAASPYGLKILQFPHDDQAGFERVFNIIPWAYKQTITECVANLYTEKNPGQVFNTPYPIVVARSDLDEDYAYAMSKSIHEAYSDYVGTMHVMKGWNLDNLKKNLTSVPAAYHEGTVRYLKEIGIWSETAEAHQERMLHRHKILSEAWDEAIKSEGKQLKDKKWEEFWINKRNEALKKEGFATYEIPAKLIVKE